MSLTPLTQKPKNIIIGSVELSGFRAFLDNQEFLLTRKGAPLSLAIFAPNGKGKSSLVDSLEFYFSEKSTLDRLGEKRIGKFSGREPLEHNKASTKGVKTQVQLMIINNTKQEVGSRKPSDAAKKPTNATTILEKAKVDFIIRGYQLRQFVEDMSADDRYTLVSKWLSLLPLVEIQKNLRSLKTKYKAQIEADRSDVERLRDLATITNNTHIAWNEEALQQWIHTEYTSKLDAVFPLIVFDGSSPTYKLLKSRKEAEDKSVGLETLVMIEKATNQIFAETPTEGDAVQTTGALFDLILSKGTLDKWILAEKNERKKAADAIFSQVWEAADKLFDEDVEQAQEDCPVCETPFEKTKAGDYQTVKLNIKAKIADLATYRTALNGVQEAQPVCAQTLLVLKSKIENLLILLEAHKFDNSVLTEYSLLMNNWNESQPLPDPSTIISFFKQLISENLAAQNKIKTSQGEYSYSKALEKVGAIIALKVDLARIEKRKLLEENLLNAFTRQASSIDKEIREYIQSFVSQLRDLTNTYYKEIQQSADIIPEINIDFASDDAANQKQLHLTINFAENRQSVLPGGYLSDSQLHALALSFRLAAIRLFNKGLPFIVLDDIVTSYDADHRLATASLLATHFADCQIILTTHDELFFKCLEDRLPKAQWQFKRILNLLPDFGPKFHDHQVAEERIEQEWQKGEHASNLIRQAEEEWLVKMCRFFGAEVRIRDVHKPYTYSNHELAEALHKCLKGSGVQLPDITGISSPFLVSMQNATFENFGSHFQDNIYSFPSVGDAKKRWVEFKEFSSYFVCKSCGHDKFTRPPTLKLALCTKCQIPFPSKKVPHTGTG